MRRQKYRQKKQSTKKFNLYIGILLLTLFLVLITIIYFVIALPRLQKFIFLDRTKDGGGEIVIVETDSITKYKIDSQKLLVSSRGLGEYKLESLWTLGEKEGYSGKLAVESVSKNYLIPVYLWRMDGKSNLNLLQKVKIKINNLTNIEPIKVLETFDLPNSILVKFVDLNIQENNVLVEVDDLMGSQETIERVSSILDTLGTKISGYSRGYDSEMDCVILGRDGDALDILTKVFNCAKKIEDQDNIKIRLGAKFAERF